MMDVGTASQGVRIVLREFQQSNTHLYAVATLSVRLDGRLLLVGQASATVVPTEPSVALRVDCPEITFVPTVEYAVDIQFITEGVPAVHRGVAFRYESPGRIVTAAPRPPVVETSSAPCIDSSPSCQSWAKAGFCTRPGNAEIMAVLCTATCSGCSNPRDTPAPLQCVDEPGYTDAHGIGCRDWSTHEDCNTASDFGYTKEQVRQLFRRCPRSCNICTPEVPTTSDKASESTNTPSGSSDLVLVSAIVVIGVALLLVVGSAMYRQRLQSSQLSTAARKLEAGGPYEYDLSGDSPDPEPFRERVAPVNDDVTIYASIMDGGSVQGSLNTPRPSARPPRRSGLHATAPSYLAPDPDEGMPGQATTLATRTVTNSPDPESLRERVAPVNDDVTIYSSSMDGGSVRGSLNTPRPSARPPRRSSLRATAPSYLAPDPNEERPGQATTLAAPAVAIWPDSASEYAYAYVSGDEVSAFGSDDEACYPLAVPSQPRADLQESLYDNCKQVGLERTNRPNQPGSAARVDIDARAHALPPLSPPDLSFRGDTADFRSMCDRMMELSATK